MDTINQFLSDNIDRVAFPYIDEELEDNTALANTIKGCCIEYARFAIEADRANVAEHAKTKVKTFGHPDPFEWSTVVDKNSIINAPEIELK